MGNGLHGILDPMMKRLAALLIALAVGAAPVALEVCQLTCASHSTHSHVAHTADAHALHHGAASQPSCHQAGHAAAHTLSPGSAHCDHDDGAIASSLVTTRHDTVAAAPVHVVVIDLANPGGAGRDDRGRVVLAPTRLELRLSSPLRI
jgi:hypothetical protein